MALPGLQVLLDDGTGTFPYDITAKCRFAYDAKRGRQDELTDVVAGQLKLVLNNTDGRFTIGSTIIASPSPIKNDQRIRIKVTANAVTVNRHTGYVQEWPVEWPTGDDTLSEVTINTTDAQARAERRILLSVVEEEMLEDNPSALYTLGEPVSNQNGLPTAVAADTSGNQQSQLAQAGSGAAVTFGADGLTTSPYTAAQLAGGKYLTAPLVFPTAPTNLAIGVFYKTTGTSQTIMKIADTFYSFGVDSLGRAVLTDGTAELHTSVPVNVGDWRFALIILTSGGATMIAEGGSFGTSSAAPTLTTNMTLELGGSANYQTGIAAPFTGSLSHAVVLTTLTAATSRETAYFLAGVTGFAGETDTARITRLAGYANIPVGSLDPSLTKVPFVDITGKSAAEALRDVADASMGLLYVNGSGALDFHNRQEVTTKSAPDITIDANQLAENTRFTVDMQGVINYFEATSTSTGIRQVARNTSSETAHGRYNASESYLVATDGEAVDRANWIVGTHAEPAPRVGQLAIDMLTLTAAQQAALLAAEADTWIRVQNLPSQTPGGTTADLVIQGFQDVVSANEGDGSWVYTANVVSKASAFPSVWILGDATLGVLGSTTRLGV